jgi:hypothetical protein
VTDVFRDIKLHDGFRSPQIGLFVAQMDDQNRRLREDIRDITPAELEWQSSAINIETLSRPARNHRPPVSP